MNTHLTALFGLEGKVALLIGAGAHLVSIKTTRTDVVAGQLGFVPRTLGAYRTVNTGRALLGHRVTQVTFIQEFYYSRPTTRIH